MESLLEHLGKDTLPRPMVEAFVEWCIWEQARPALMLVLEKTTLYELAQEFSAARDMHTLMRLVGRAPEVIRSSRRKTGPLGISAAEAATFEFHSLTKAVTESEWDPEGAAFFAARVCGWAGWAASGFNQPALKNRAETEARQQQEACLQSLWRDYGGR